MASSLRAVVHTLTPTLAALLAMSILALAIGLERLRFTLSARRRLAQGRRTLLQHLGPQDGAPHGDASAARAANDSLPPHPATALFALILRPSPPRTSALRRAQMAVQRQVRRRLWVLGSIGTLAPFVGLMGTVIGIMEAFRAMGLDASGGVTVVSQGISEALVTTAAGIFVAVEAVLFYNYLQVLAASYGAELRDAVEELGECSDLGPHARP